MSSKNKFSPKLSVSTIKVNISKYILPTYGPFPRGLSHTCMYMYMYMYIPDPLKCRVPLPPSAPFAYPDLPETLGTVSVEPGREGGGGRREEGGRYTYMLEGGRYCTCTCWREGVDVHVHVVGRDHPL